MLEKWQEEEVTELVLDFSNGNRTGYLEDAITELVDGYLPIYYNDIVKQWQEMPSEFDNMGAVNFGMPDSVDIYQLMTLDLLNYIGELVRVHANKVIEQVGELELV